MDLTPYEDDDDATLHRKLVAAKVARKRAEEDLKLLCNRIGLLKMEEGKVSYRLIWIKDLNLKFVTGCQEDWRDKKASKSNNQSTSKKYWGQLG